MSDWSEAVEPDQEQDAPRTGSDLDAPEGSSFTRAQWGWVVCDVGSWGFATTLLTTYMPVYFRGSGEAEAHHLTSAWSFAMSTAMILAGIFGPLAGWLADRWSLRKKLLLAFSLLTAVSGMLFPSSLSLSMQATLAVVIVVSAAYSVTITMYNALLASMFKPAERHHASVVSTAWSNAGAATLLGAVYALHQILIPENDYHGEKSVAFLWNCVFISGVWWIIFLIPLAKYCPELEVDRPADSGLCSSILQPLSQVAKLPDLCRFVIASILLNEASGVCYQMALLFAISIGVISPEVAVLTTIYNRAVSVPFAGFWVLLIRGGFTPSMCFMLVQLLLLCAVVLCACLANEWEYWVLTTILACAGTGSFSFSRSMMASLVPGPIAAQVFGLTASLGRMSGFIGPLVYGAVSHATGNARSGFVPIVGFVLLSLGVTWFVDIDRGSQVAAEYTKEYHQSQASAVHAEEAEEASLIKNQF